MHFAGLHCILGMPILEIFSLKELNVAMHPVLFIV